LTGFSESHLRVCVYFLLYGIRNSAYYYYMIFLTATNRITWNRTLEPKSHILQVTTVHSLDSVRSLTNCQLLRGKGIKCVQTYWIALVDNWLAKWRLFTGQYCLGLLSSCHQSGKASNNKLTFLKSFSNCCTWHLRGQNLRDKEKQVKDQILGRPYDGTILPRIESSEYRYSVHLSPHENIH